MPDQVQQTEPGSVLSPTARGHYRVIAHNLSATSENKIHDDGIAQRFGFTGGLVPGVEVYAYATHAVIDALGAAWLKRGYLEIRFGKPVYDGHPVDATAEPVDAGRVAVLVTSQGIECAKGSATLSSALDDALPASHSAGRFPLPPASRPPASEATLAAGRCLATAPLELTPAECDAYIDAIGETLPIYRSEGIVHPGRILRLCNSALRDNVVLPPWIHTGSRVQCHRAVRVGEVVQARAVVAQCYERKGHKLVDLDVVVVANDRLAARVLHTAIWQLRGSV